MMMMSQKTHRVPAEGSEGSESWLPGLGLGPAHLENTISLSPPPPPVLFVFGTGLPPLTSSTNNGYCSVSAMASQG